MPKEISQVYKHNTFHRFTDVYVTHCMMLNVLLVWTAKITSKDGQQWAEISTWVKASFSVSVCEMNPSSQCKRIEGNKFQNLSVVRNLEQDILPVGSVIITSEQM